jgi:tetratricopeptide (TPR) repeat protein
VLQAPIRHLLPNWYDVQCRGAARVLTLFSGDVMSDMAFVYRDLGRHQDEFTMREKVLQFRRKNTPRARHPDIGLAMHNFVPCLNSAGEHGKAFDLQCEAIRILAQSLPKNHPHLLSAQRQLAVATDELVGIYEASERHEELRSTVLKALEWLTTAPDCSEHNTNVGVLMCKLSGAYLAMGQYQNAAIWQEKGLQMHRRELTEEHATTCGAMGNLAFIYSKLSRHQEALSLREKVLHISRRVLPKDHVDIGIAVNNYARSLQDLHRHHEALPLLKQNLEFNKRVLPMDHPEIAASMNNLAITFKALHRNDEALQLLEEALEFRRRVLPAHHPQIGQSMMNLSSALCKVSRFTDALAMSGRAVDFFRQHMPPGHPELGGCV